MPNWCSNYIEITGDGRKIKDFIDKSYAYPCYYGEEDTEKEKRYCFNGLHPVPEEIRKSGYNMAGYDWQNANWGTKWDTLDDATRDFKEWLDNFKLDREENDWYDEIGFSFQTAWCPCVEWLLHVSTLYPDLEFTISYEEGGCCIFGKETIVDGGVIEESHYDSETEYRYYVNDEEIETIISEYIDWTHDGLDKDENSEEEFKEVYEDLCRKFSWYEDDIKEILLEQLNNYFETEFKFVD